MRITEDNLLEDIQKCMTDPVSDVLQNFSLEKSRKFYEKRVKQFNEWCFEDNPACKLTKEEIPFGNLDELSLASQKAANLVENLKEMPHVKGADWIICSEKIVVYWHRLKTFDEWLHKWLEEALTQAYNAPEDGARLILERELGGWTYTNTAIHMYMEWILTKEMLERLSQYEWYWKIDWRDIEQDIEDAKRWLEDMEEENSKKDVTVLTLKM